MIKYYNYLGLIAGNIKLLFCVSFILDNFLFLIDK